VHVCLNRRYHRPDPRLAVLFGTRPAIPSIRSTGSKAHYLESVLSTLYSTSQSIDSAAHCQSEARRITKISTWAIPLYQSRYGKGKSICPYTVEPFQVSLLFLLSGILPTPA
jgi:hypothetical protein